MPCQLVVQRRVPAGAGLELVEEVQHDFGERQVVGELDALRREVVHPGVLAAALLAELHDRSDELSGGDDLGLDERLADLRDRGGVGHVGGVVDLELLAVCERQVELHRGHRREQLEVVLALQALAHDVHVQQAQEAAAKAEAERVGGLGLPRERSVVERQLLQRVAQVGIAVGVDREQPAEDHRLHLPVARQRLGGLARAGPRARAACGRARDPGGAAGAGAGGEGVSDPQLRDVLHAGDQVADLAGGELVGGHHLRGEAADVVDVGVQAARHRADRLALREDPVDDTHVGDHPAVLVELGVEDQRARRRLRIAGRRGHTRDELLQDLRHARSGLAADPPDRVGGLADQLGHFAGDPLGLGAGQVDLVQARDQLQPGLDRQIGVGDRLGLDPLGGVDHQQRPLAGRQRAGDLVGEVDVPGGVDQVQLIGLPVATLEEHAHGLRLDRDPPLALQVHRVEHLRAHVAGCDGVRQLEDPVGERGLAVVDMGDDAEVADVDLVHGPLQPRRASRGQRPQRRRRATR